MSRPTNPETQPSETVHCAVNPEFCGWLAEAGGALAISTYQANKLLLVGWDGRQVSVLSRDFDRPMGLAASGLELAMATQFSVMRFSNARELAHELEPESPGRYDALYLPRVSYHVGAIQAHDLAFGSENLWLVNTRFGCLAMPGVGFSFEPRWHPRFLSALVPEDRCHLNGLALVDGRPRYVTALGESDEAGGWRPRRIDGGILIDVESGEMALRELSMPHSPRWHDGRLWLLNSGAGELLAIDLERGQRDVVCTLPGFLRGLAFAGPFAVVGLSRIRERHAFSGLPISERFSRLRCGVSVVDLRTGRSAGHLEFTSGCDELYDVVFLSGILRPMILSLNSGVARNAFSLPNASCWAERGPA